MKLCFEEKIDSLTSQFSDTKWIEESGISEQELYDEVRKLGEKLLQTLKSNTEEMKKFL